MHSTAGVPVYGKWGREVLLNKLAIDQHKQLGNELF